MLVGRQSTDMGSTFVTYGTGAENTVKLDGGVGLQEAEFMDGLRVSVQTNQTVNMTVELREGINPGTLNDNAMPLNTFMWVVKTSNPNQVVDATMFFPCKFAIVDINFLHPIIIKLTKSSQPQYASTNATLRRLPDHHASSWKETIECNKRDFLVF